MVNSDRTVLTVDDWWKAKTRDVERKGMGKGKQKGKAITERLACVSFDAFHPAYPPKSRV